MSEETKTSLKWSQALDAMELGHNVATQTLRLRNHHLRAQDNSLAALQLINTMTGEVLVMGYVPTTSDRIYKWEIVR